MFFAQFHSLVERFKYNQFNTHMANAILFAVTWDPRVSRILHKNIQKQNFGRRQPSIPWMSTIKATGKRKVYFLLLSIFCKGLKTYEDRNCLTPYSLEVVKI